jgi:iron complex outermembrane receptor protein
MSNPQQCKPSPTANNRRYLAQVLLLAVMVAEAVHGDVINGKHHFDIPAQPLNQALLLFGRQGQQQLMYSTDMAEKLRSHALQGDYSAAEAISILLADSPLQAVTTGEGTMTLQPKAVEYHDQIQPEALPPVKVSGTAEYDSTDPYNTDYTRPNASSATKTDTPIMETPFAVQVIPKQVMQDQQAVRLETAVENISGTYSSRGAGGIGGGQSATFLRGFETFEYYRDGTRYNGGFNINGPRELANVERVEVLKGPASILYGRLEPGGMVNIVTKRPLDTPYYSLQQQFGSFDFYRTTADATGPVTQDKSVLYRVNLAYENSGSFREFLEHDRVFFAPTFHWTINDQTQANFHMEYQHDKSPFDHGFPVAGNRPAHLPRERNLGEPGSRNESETFNVGFDWSHAFNDNWTLRHRFDAVLLPKMDTVPSVYSGFLGGPCSPATGCQVNRLTYMNKSNSENYYTTLDLLGKFETWGLKHNVLVGGDFFHQVNESNFAWAFSQPIDAYNPVHTGVDPRVLDNPNLSGPSGFTEEWGGFYTQDQIELPYHVHLLAGFRYDTVRYRSDSDLTFNFGSPFVQSSHNLLQQEAVKPRFGVLYQPIPEVSFYGNYVENFGVSNGFNADGTPLPPTSATQWEGGVKTELFDKRLTASLAWFDITKQNIAVPDPDPLKAASGFSRAIGEVRNQGIEFDVAGEVLPGWNVIGNYSYIDSKITKDSAPIFDANFNAIGVGPGNQGNRLFNVPRNLASLWTTYEFLGGDLRGLKFGGGVLMRSQRQCDNANTFQLPGYATVNLLASYSINVGKSKITTQLNIDNLLNKYYFDSATNSTIQGNYPGAPRTVLGSIRLEF